MVSWALSDGDLCDLGTLDPHTLAISLISVGPPPFKCVEPPFVRVGVELTVCKVKEIEWTRSSRVLFACKFN